MDSLCNVNVLEAIARKTLKGYNPGLLNGEPVAVPIESIAEHLGLSIEYQCLRKNGLILGETVFDDTSIPVYLPEENRYALIRVSGGTILLDASLLRRGAEGRLRFTCAHELAHWLIHTEIYEGTGQTAALLNPKKASAENILIERQADVLATALLMPKGQVKRAFYRVRTSKDPVAALAKTFEVSKQAMRIFLREHYLM